MFFITTLLKFASMIRKTRRLAMDFGYLILLLLISAILYNNSEFFNAFSIVGFKLGSLLLLIVSLFSLRYALSVSSFFLGSYRGLNTILKFIIMISLIIFVLYFFLNQGKVLSSLKENIEIIDLSRFNPVIKNNITNSTG